MNLASMFHAKAKMWKNGRKEQVIIKAQNTIWVHVSSLGEFEQGRILIEKIKSNHPTVPIVLTFFSPSGYELRKNYKFADYIYYLPLDTKKNAIAFLETINPKLIIFVKYDLWWNYILESQKRNIPFYLISAFLKQSDIHFKRNPYKSIYKKLTGVFYQDSNSLSLSKEFMPNNTYLAGDTRVDSVIKTSEDPLSLPLIKKWTTKEKVFIGGSVWHDEIKLIKKHFSKTPAQWILAPHDISESFLSFIESELGIENCIRHSDLKNSTKKILIIDSIGKLSSIYQFGELAVIGGAFAKGLHNTLEPMAFGVPCIFGPKYNRFVEAEYLVKTKAGISINNYVEFENAIKFLSNNSESSELARRYIDDSKGSTQIIYEHLIPYL